MSQIETPVREGETIDDRRSIDRRTGHKLFADWKWAYRGRRRTPRRDAEKAFSEVDWYSPHLLAVAMGIVAFSGLDATLTLILLQEGLAYEANPIMRVLMEHDTQMFANLKTLMTSAAVVFLVACSNTRVFRRFQAHRLLYVTLFGYALLVSYEVYLLSLGG